jgi:predicted AlkP superfamily phosphohydrolase/phosphomutase
VFVVSDHGFTPFRRGFNLNTWLLENGYHRLRDRRYQKDTELFQHTAWSSTRAYGYGLNGLYLNLRGREARGSVAPGEEAANLRHELCRRLEAYRDPVTGEQVVLRAYPAEEVYSAAQRHVAPDIVLGFAPGYRISWSSPLGRMPAEVMENNDNRWSGDHCVCPDVVPGILACNRPIRCERPAFTDVAPTLLRLYGIPIPPEMVGRPMML